MFRGRPATRGLRRSRRRTASIYFYFSGHNASLDRKTIGVAVADSPEGPFTAQPEAMILNNEAVTSGQAIDPATFTDPATGKNYLFWGKAVRRSTPSSATTCCRSSRRR